MIGRLTGQVSGRGTDRVLIDVGGVGYVVEGSARMLAALPDDGEVVTLAIETYVREDQLRLFGFLGEEERGWFRLLMSVQGVGARVALAIQGILSGADLAQAIALEDKAMISQAPGVGAKVAGRIVQELANKIPEEQIISGGLDKTSTEGGQPSSSATQEALSALLNLGYPRVQAHHAIQAAFKTLGEEAQTQDIIKQALKDLGKEL
ncbi:MAG: Holliday junction branch migration protein RuvA [Alphaproteobacteria bacterium]|nr:Holliday junction branch migration protein RuvA [Alphaproteobacteria bacterium]MBE8220019.1 Holliday junction branch migration protein RuvA [Alphaproteobacteria bacterium]